MEEEAFMKRLLCTPRNFSTSFKKAFGVLPNEYRGGRKDSTAASPTAS